MAQDENNPHFETDPHIRCPLIIMMSGYPATGKSHAANRLLECLNRANIKAEIVASDILRRKLGHVVHPKYFDENDIEAAQLRAQVYSEMLLSAERLLGEFQAVILDAGYNRRAAREKVYAFAKGKSASVLIVNTVCDDEGEIRSRISRRDPRNPKEVANDFQMHLLGKSQAQPIAEGFPMIVIDSISGAMAYVSSDETAKSLAELLENTNP